MENNTYFVNDDLMDTDDYACIENFFNIGDENEIKKMLSLILLSFRLMDVGLDDYDQNDDHVLAFRSAFDALQEALSMLDNQLIAELDNELVSKFEEKS